MLSLSISRFLKILLVTTNKNADRIYRMKKHIWLAINGLWKIDTRTAATKLLNARYSNSCHKKHKDRQKKYYDGKNLDHKPSIWWNLVKMPQQSTTSTFNISQWLVHVIINPAHVNWMGKFFWHPKPNVQTSNMLVRWTDLIASSPCCATIVARCVKIPPSSVIVDSTLWRATALLCE